MQGPVRKGGLPGVIESKGRGCVFECFKWAAGGRAFRTWKCFVSKALQTRER